MVDRAQAILQPAFDALRKAGLPEDLENRGS
jgi:hypothetical protein